MALAGRFDSQLTLLRIILPPRVSNGGLSPESADFLIKVRDDLFKEAIEYLQTQKGSLRQQNFKVSYQVAESEDIAAEIINVVRDINADTVVMCTHGRGGISRWLFGSVASKVLQTVDIPVLLIRPSRDIVSD
jgi:nucleotide-binding universal stress UspA family protein